MNDGDRGRALDRGRVVAVALELLDELGLDGLTMRRLADRLGVTAASLYWHVRDKEELLGLLSDAIAADIADPDPGRPWREALATLARDCRRAVSRHRDGARVMVESPPFGPNRRRSIAALRQVFAAAGMDPEQATEAGQVLNVFLTGLLVDETMSPSAGTPRGEGGEPLRGPRGGATSGHLQIRGSRMVTVRADPRLEDLYRIDYEGRAPRVEEGEGVVSIHQRQGRRMSCAVALNPALPWAVTLQHGAWQTTARLDRLPLTAFEVEGGVNRMTLVLGAPSGVVPLRFGGGVHELLVQRPAGAAIGIQLRRSSSDVSLDGMRFDAVGAGTRWESAGYQGAADRYEVEVGSGARRITIRAAPTEPEAQPDPAPQPLSAADPDRVFEVALEVLLDGLERRLERRSRSVPAVPPSMG